MSKITTLTRRFASASPKGRGGYVYVLTHQPLRVAHKRRPTLRVDLLVLQVQRQRLDRPGALDSRARGAPTAARSLAADALERRDVVRTFELKANVVVAQLADTLGRHVDP